MAVKRKSIGQRALAGAKEALANARGEHVPGLRVHEPVDAAAVRKGTGLSQTEFAKRFGIEVAALRDWEQKRRTPERTAQILLRVIEQAPEIAAKAARSA